MQLIKIQPWMKYLTAVWSLYPIGLPGIFQLVPKWFASLHQNPVLIKLSESTQEAVFLLHRQSNAMRPVQGLQLYLVLYLLFSLLKTFWHAIVVTRRARLMFPWKQCVKILESNLQMRFAKLPSQNTLV